MRKIILISLILVFPLISSAQDATTQATAPYKTYKKQLVVTTDRKVYKQGELIKVTVRNNFGESIFSQAASKASPVFCIEYVERKAPNGHWEKLFAQCQYPHCIWDIDFPGEIKPGQSVTFEWEPLIYINGTSKSIVAGEGKYRLLITYQIRKDSSPKNWKWLRVYSTEFIIK